MNEHFVSIKVDREERPDVDAVYMQATTAMTGHGGWPMTVVLDHDGEPFFAGTYFPDQPRHGQPAFRQVLQALAEAWRERGDEVAARGRTLREHLRASRWRRRGADRRGATLDAAVGPAGTRVRPGQRRVRGRAEVPAVDGAGVPAAARARSGRSTMAAQTLEAMARGGIHDQLAGGFARYCVDADWVVPHFEKMLYDNALLLRVYAGWGHRPSASGPPRGSRDFLLGELRTPEGGFASALDADSEGAEGTYYVWTPAQLTEVLGAGRRRLGARAVSAVTDAGTFEHGTSTLQLREDPDDLERWFDVQRRLPRPRGRARAAGPRRQGGRGLERAGDQRAVPGRARCSTRPAYVEAAVARRRAAVAGARRRRPAAPGVAGRRGRRAGRGAGGLRLRRRRLPGPAAGDRRRGLAGAGGHAARQRRWTHFAADDGGFFDTADDAEALVARPRDPSDNASPSGLSAMVHALADYAALTGSGRHRDAAEAALATVAPIAERAPRFAGWSLAAAVSMLDGPEEVAVVGAAGAAARRARGRCPPAPRRGRGGRRRPPRRRPAAGRPGAGRRRARGVRLPAPVCERPVTDPRPAV